MPVFHSKDLVNWKLIGYGLTRPGQVELPGGLRDSRGIYAVTIHYHDGLFYLITTCVQCQGNFYVTASDPAGPWSDPVWLKTRGIDPSLFWDDDGKSYYVGHANISGVSDWPDKNGVWLQEIDLKEGKMLGTPKQLTHGHATNARWTEGPHIYKIDNTYILLVAEGGTGFNHAVTVFHSDSVWGPYVPYHTNPVLTHRHLGKDYPIHSTGHADMIQTQNGEWWAVMLAKRLYEGKTLLARETFLTPVEIQNEEGKPIPVFNPGHGKLLSEQERPNLPWTPWISPPIRDNFEKSELALEWNFLRTPYTKWYNLNKGKLNIQLRPEVIDSLVNPSLIARRIQHHHFYATTSMNFKTRQANEQAGLVAYRNSGNHVRLVKDNNSLVLLWTKKGHSEELARVPYAYDNVLLRIEGDGIRAQFSFGQNEDNLAPIGTQVDLSIMADEVALGFNGPYVGMYATSNGKPSRSVAAFDWFEYQNK
jgi:xylan 1,4-beta-xylosidase